MQPRMGYSATHGSVTRAKRADGFFGILNTATVFESPKNAVASKS